MTMRHHDGQSLSDGPQIDPAKRYQYTWPGQTPKTVSGAALIQLCKGADPSMLKIREVSKKDEAAAAVAPPAPVTAPALSEGDA